MGSLPVVNNTFCELRCTLSNDEEDLSVETEGCSQSFLRFRWARDEAFLGESTDVLFDELRRGGIGTRVELGRPFHLLATLGICAGSWVGATGEATGRDRLPGVEEGSFAFL